MRARLCRVLMVVLVLCIPLAAVEAQPICPGDCDGDGAVTIDEVVLIINLILVGGASPDICPGAFANGNLSVATIVQGINSIMVGCPIWTTPGIE